MAKSRKSNRRSSIGLGASRQQGPAEGLTIALSSWANARIVLACLLVGCALVSGAGCAGSPGHAGVVDLAQYALAHRRLPPGFLQQAGVKARFEKMPFTCGSAHAAAEAEPRKAIAKMSEEERRLAQASRPKAIETCPPPEPDYTVDLNRVEEVRVAWLGERRIVILRHPVLPDAESWPRLHPGPPARVIVKGAHVSGPGPVSIWDGDRFLFWSDMPWILMAVPRAGDPWLLVLNDCLQLGGPIEVGFCSRPMNGKALGGCEGGFWLDAGATGCALRLNPKSDAPVGRPIVRIDRLDSNGNWRGVGRLGFDEPGGELDFREDAPSQKRSE